MKKINFVALDSSTLQWLRQVLLERRTESEATAELYRGVEELISGQLDSLMLEPDSSVSVPANDGLTCEDLTIHARSRQVLRGGEEIQLTPKEFDILYFLARNRGIVFTKEQIYQAIWEEDYYTTDSNIMAFIRKLRKKIEPNPDAPEYILTIWGIGYKFNDKL